jgi:Protein of unknown function (DUF3303)
MLVMVIERFRNGHVKAISERFARDGRMLPPDVIYVSSWVDAKQMRCFQLMEAPRVEALQPWIAHWQDLVEFEIVPVLTSQDFWATVHSG